MSKHLGNDDNGNGHYGSYGQEVTTRPSSHTFVSTGRVVETSGGKITKIETNNGQTLVPDGNGGFKPA